MGGAAASVGGWVGITHWCLVVALHGSGLCSLLAASSCLHPAHRTPEMLKRGGGGGGG